ncbi:MAG: hypothetical protein ABIX28_26305, partial [Vicinamibacterales bacterium]
MNLEPARTLFACLRALRPTPVVVDLAREFSPRWQRQGPDCVVCDVSGLGRLLGEPAAIGAELARAAAVYGAAVRVAIAPTMTASMLLTLAFTELIVVTADAGAALAGLPLVHLQQLVAAATGTTLLRPATRAGQDAARQRHARAFDMARRWGVATIGAFAALDPGELSARMGQEGLRLQQLAQGSDPGPLVPDPDVPRYVERMELEWPLDTLEPLSFVLARLLDPLAVALERADRGAAAIRLDLRLVDRTMHGRVLQLPAAMRDPRVLRTLLMLDLESHPPGAAVDIVTIEIDPAPGRVIQYSLLERAVPSAEVVATLTARLSALVGETRCGSPALLDTHGPDGFEMRRYEIAEAALRHSPRELLMPNAIGGNVSWQGDGPPPPDRHAAPPLPPVLRRFRPPVAVRVTVDRGRPIRLAIDRRGMPGGAIDRSAGPWRTSGAWWTAPGQWDRDEWDIA